MTSLWFALDKGFSDMSKGCGGLLVSKTQPEDVVCIKTQRFHRAQHHHVADVKLHHAHLISVKQHGVLQILTHHLRETHRLSPDWCEGTSKCHCIFHRHVYQIHRLCSQHPFFAIDNHIHLHARLEMSCSRSNLWTCNGSKACIMLPVTGDQSNISNKVNKLYCMYCNYSTAVYFVGLCTFIIPNAFNKRNPLIYWY